MNMDLSLFKEIEKSLNELQEDIAADLIIGRATSYDDYRYRVGRIRGIQDAMKLAREAQDRILGVERERKN